MHLAIEFAQEVNRIEVLTAAEFVGDPIPWIAGVIEVEHRSDRVDSKSIDMESIEPKQGIGDQKVTDLMTSVIEDHGPPVGMLTLARVLVLVQCAAIEAVQAQGVFGEVGRDPIDDHTDGVLVAVVDEVHEVFGGAIAACGREIAGRLVPPRSTERMLGNRQEFQVGKSHLLAILDQLVGQFAIIEPTVVGRRALSPRPQMDLVDRDGLLKDTVLRTIFKPTCVVPLVGKRMDDRGGSRWDLGIKSQRIRFIDDTSVEGSNSVFVVHTGLDVRHKELPDT